MRIFKDFPEAVGEIKRDLKEMGIKVDNVRMQDKEGSFPTVELFNYGYTVLEPRVGDLVLPCQEWVDQEWTDRVDGINGRPSNPGKSWEHRKDVWTEFLEDGKRFSYTYSERFAIYSQVNRVIYELKQNPLSRQLYVSLWDPTQDPMNMNLGRRVPCSLGWHFLMRRNQLDVTYFMRSCDFATHWAHDVALTMMLLYYIADQAKIQAGSFSQFINSFHVYEKDVEDVF